MYKNRYINGTTKVTLSPNENISRSMIVTILWNMEGRPEVTEKNKFSDVKNNVWYTDAIIWATSNGIVHGYDNGKFAPNANATRQELAVIIANYCKYKNKYIDSNVNLSSYKDSDKVASWALPAVKWAVSNRIINGAENGTKINPTSTAIRAEALVMLKNYIDTIK